MAALFLGKQWTSVPFDMRRKIAPLIRDLKHCSPAGYTQRVSQMLCREMHIICNNQQEVPEFILKAAEEMTAWHVKRDEQEKMVQILSNPNIY